MKTNFQQSKTIWVLSMCLFCCLEHAAYAGPLRDKIMERRLAQQQEEMLEAAGSASSNPVLPPGVKLVKDFPFGSDPSYWKSVSPIHRLAADANPVMAVCSSTRTDHPCLQAHNFANSAASLGVRVSVLEQALTHKQINQDLGVPGAYADAVEAFMSSLDGTVKNMLMNGAGEN